MSSNYDECLDQNPFFKAIQETHSDLITKATEEDWIICVPRIGTLEATAPITTEDILEHVLVPNFDLPATHFSTLTKREVIINDKSITLKGGETIRILFNETFYNKSQKFRLWCIERPLHGCSSNYEAYSTVKTLQDSIKLLWRSLDDLNKIIQAFLDKECEFDELDTLQEKISLLYCTATSTSSDINFNLAVETYLQHRVHHKLFRAVCNCTWQVDAKFNKIVRNFSDINLKDLEIGGEACESITSAKRSLNSLNKFTTVLGKIECLKRTVNILTHAITADDLLKSFVFLLIKSNLNNWIGNLLYITHFRFSSLNLSAENSFLITTLEAAIEFIKSGALRCQNVHASRVINSLSSLFACIKEGQLDAIKCFFENQTLRCHPLCECDKCESAGRFNLHSHDDKGCTALHIACLTAGNDHQPCSRAQLEIFRCERSAHALIVEYLISKKADVNAVDYSESVPLHYAALKGNQNALLLLLHANAELGRKNQDGNTPLHLAANNGHENCVKALLYFAEQKGLLINVNSGNNMGDTPLHFASKWGYASIAHILLQYGADCNLSNKHNRKALDLAHNSYLKNLLESNVPRTETTHPITVQDLPVRPKNTHQIKKIDLVLKSIENNDLPLVCYYLGIPNPTSAINLNTKSTCHPLCTCQTCQKQFEGTATIHSTKSSQALNLNTCNSEGYSPLHVAAKCGRTDIFRLLLDSGALVNVKTLTNQETPLHLACKNQRIQIVRELLQCGGCHLDEQDIKGNVPLHYACFSNNSRIVELLLSHGNDCNVKNCEGKTPLQEAKGRMLYGIVSLLKGKAENSDSSESSSDLFSF